MKITVVETCKEDVIIDAKDMKYGYLYQEEGAENTRSIKIGDTVLFLFTSGVCGKKILSGDVNKCCPKYKEIGPITNITFEVGVNQ